MELNQDYIRINAVLPHFPSDDKRTAVILPGGAARLWGWVRDEVDWLMES